MSSVFVEETSLQDIADAIREKNGTETTYKPSEMGSAIRAIESGGGAFPELIYETTFEVEETKSNGSSSLLSISTGLETDYASNQEIILLEIQLESYSTDIEPTTTKHAVLTRQFLYTDQYNTYNASNSGFCTSIMENGSLIHTTGQVQGIYNGSRLDVKLSNITLYYRCPNNVYVVSGTYKLKLYRTGLKNAENITV